MPKISKDSVEPLRSYNENVVARKRFPSIFGWPFSNFDGAPRMHPLRYRAEILRAGSRGGPCDLEKKAKGLVKPLRSYNENVAIFVDFFAIFKL